MLKDLHVPIELPSLGRELTEEEIEAVKEEHIGRQIQRWPRSFRLYFSSLDLDVFEANMRPSESTMEVRNFSVGVRELAGHGLGTRILKEGISLGKRMDPDLETITTSWEHISVLNAFAKVLGPENVAARAGRVNYGHGYDKPLEDIIVPGISRVQWIEATLGQDS